MEINYLSEMNAYFDEILYGNHQKFTTKRIQATNQLKSYIVENHLDSGKSTQSYDEKVIEFFNKINSGLKYDFKIRQSKDEHLFINSSSEGTVYIDTSQKRFWKIHSVAKAEVSDYFHRILTKKKNFDQIWLPIPFLLGLPKFGEMYGIGISFTEELKDDEFESLYPDNSDNLSMNIRRLYVKELLKLMKNSSMKEVMGVNKISILDPSSEENESYIIDDITFFGKVTARGTSYSKHSHILESILYNYKKNISNIEDEYALHFDPGTSAIEGYPIEVVLKRGEINIQKLVSVLFSGNKPFSLWGIPQWKSENYCQISAVDLHNGNYGKMIDFEVFPSLIRAYLPQGTCGNSISRLLTNIHQSIDATAVIKGREASDFFKIL
ncbi:hypothetical protein [Domibacillus epiphyticus]|uniref:Uncharacterized protein n=1 Tax=Domibacillus epiphyticus TaxID=1714355 RepID=A0A1V2A8B7_9BACI|nr:hypothetical protein [Domibacillus epiphyticus]OMP67064.1 hypothetical protein BTO28_08765 [Domibacillus epiphyticus]